MLLEVVKLGARIRKLVQVSKGTVLKQYELLRML